MIVLAPLSTTKWSVIELLTSTGTAKVPPSMVIATLIQALTGRHGKAIWNYRLIDPSGSVPVSVVICAFTVSIARDLIIRSKRKIGQRQLLLAGGYILISPTPSATHRGHRGSSGR